MKKKILLFFATLSVSFVSSAAHETEHYIWTSDENALIEYSLDNRDFIVENGISLYERFSLYRPYIEKVADSMNVPKEIAVLAAVESSFIEDAKSQSGAVGMWQFLKPTAEEYGLRIDNKVDERLDWKKSTLAAITYLKWLAEENYDGDYETAIIAYNYGIGRTEKLVKLVESRHAFRLIDSGKLPKESQQYLLKFLTNLHLFNYFDDYGIPYELKKKYGFADTAI